MKLIYEPTIGLVTEEETGLSIAALTRPHRDKFGPMFAAAPEMLEALEDVTRRLAWLNSDDDAHILEATDKARAAIAKAKGE